MPLGVVFGGQSRSAGAKPRLIYVRRDPAKLRSATQDDWLQTVLMPQLAGVEAALAKLGTPAWDPTAFRSLSADLSGQINAAAAAGAITAEQETQAVHLLAEIVRSHGGVVTERSTVGIPTTVKLRGPFGRSREVAIAGLNLKVRQRLYDALVRQLDQSVAAGSLAPKVAAEAAAQARQQYGIAPQ